MNNQQYRKKMAFSPRQWASITTVTIIVGVVAVVLFSSFQAFRIVHSYSDKPLIDKNPTTTKHSYYSNDIINSTLFGQFSSNKQLSNITLPKTKLQLTLRGAFTANDPSKASAMIEGSDKRTKNYNVGSTISGQTKLKAVYSDRVILANNDNLETLYFSDQQSTSANNNKRLTTSTQNTSASVTDPQRQAFIQQRLQELRNRSKN